MSVAVLSMSSVIETNASGLAIKRSSVGSISATNNNHHHHHHHHSSPPPSPRLGSPNISPSTSKTSLLSTTPSRSPSPPPVKADESGGVYLYLDSFIKSLNRVLSSETEIPPSPTTPVAPAAQITSDWQASYLSPVHTKLKREGRQLEPHKEKDIAALRAKFNGVLPFFRVWELKVEEMDSESPAIGRGTPPRPNRQIFTRELSATRLFLKDYQKRRGMTRLSNSSVSETEMDPSSLRRPAKPKPMPTTINTAPPVSVSKTAKTQSLSPELLIERRKSVSSHRQPSKLIS